MRALKFNGAQSASREITKLLHGILLDTASVLVYVPTPTGLVRGRGYDQARLLCRQLALDRGLQRLSRLRRSGQTHQVGASREQRIAQVSDVLRVVRASVVAGTHIFLVGDVLPTSATLDSAARVLIAAGAARVDAVVLARV